MKIVEKFQRKLLVWAWSNELSYKIRLTRLGTNSQVKFGNKIIE